MTPAQFEKKIRHLDLEPNDILSGAIAALSRVLIKKGIATPEELQRYFLDWVQTQQMPPARKRKRNE